MMEDGVIAAQDLSKFFGDVVGVNDVTVRVKHGITELLGPNGAGKSTFLKIITGQMKPTQGSVRVLGKDPWREANLFRRIGFCPEQDALDPSTTGLRFVETMLRLHGIAPKEALKRSREVLADLNLADVAERPMGEYSRGMRQRAKLAQAIAHDPELLILDEPMTGLDPEGRAFVSRRIRAWAAAGKSVLVSSHILHEVQAMTDEFLLIYRGRIRASGNVREVRSLLDEHPHRLLVRCDRPAVLAQLLLAEGVAEGVDLRDKGSALAVRTRTPGPFFEKLPDLVERGGVRVGSMISEDDSLDAVFRYLVDAEESA